MAKAQKGKGDAFVEEAQALLNKKSLFSSGSRNAEDAAETYEKAANAYKVGALNEEAGNAYMRQQRCTQINFRTLQLPPSV